MSPRQSVAEDLADTCVFGNLNDSYGVTLAKSEKDGKSFWLVTFAKARTLDGLIRVYSPNFIQVKWQGALAVATDLPGKGHEVFRSVSAAKKFLQDHFVQR